MPAEGSESAMATGLNILASVLSNLKHKLRLAGMPTPDWLEAPEDMPAKDFRDRCFKWAVCLKAAGKAGRLTDVCQVLTCPQKALLRS